MSEITRLRKLTEEQTVAKLHMMAMAKLRIDAAIAVAEADFSELKKQLAATIAEDEEIIARNQPDVILYITAHKAEFADAKKKTREDNLVKWGVKKNSNTEIDDEDALVAWARTNGYLDLIKEGESSPIKTAVATRLKKNQEIPGARISSAYEPFWEVRKTLKGKLDKTSQK